MAETKRRLRMDGVFVVNPIAANSVNPCALALANTRSIDSDVLFSITSTTRLVYNSCPVKISSCSVIGTCTKIARAELSEHLISNAMGTHNHMLRDICRSIVGEMDFDSVWCSWVLIVYLCSNPRGRDILRATSLTDVDIQSAIAFERYGSEEIRKRARQKKEKCAEKRTRQEYAEDTDSSSEVLSAKRKRNIRGSSSIGISDSYILLEFWHHAFQSEDKSVLLTLAAHSKRSVRDAAMCTLSKQAEGTEVADNMVLQCMSTSNAMKSAHAVGSFVGRRKCDTPSILTLSTRDDYSGVFKVACGFQRIDKEAASSCVHACFFPPLHIRPTVETGIAIAWSTASQLLTPRSEEATSLPVVVERNAEIIRMEKAARSGGPRAVLEREISNMNSYVSGETASATPTEAAGTTRSFISILAKMSLNASHQHSASLMVEEAKAAIEAASARPLAGAALKYSALLGTSRDANLRVEPIATPSSALAVGIGANEAMRRWMAGKTRRNDPCLKHLGVSSTSELSKDVPCVLSSEALPLLTIVDFEVERVGEPIRQDVNSKASLAQTSIGLHVCGDGAARVPDLVEQLVRHKTETEGEEGIVDAAMQARAAILVASSQASFIGGSLAGPLTAGYTNQAVASSKKIQVPDINKIFFLCVYDCYAVGFNNVQRCFDGSVYSGTYGSRIDTGFTPAGLNANNFRSDRRQHGNASLSEEVASELTVKFAENQYIDYDRQFEDGTTKRVYAQVPTAARGIPHGFIPGLHSVTKSYCDFLESSRDMTGREDADMVDSIACLPFSAFTQSLRPDLEPTSDASLRTCFRDEMETSAATGRAYLVDSTPEDLAIAKEPLFRRPCQVSCGDCPFSTSYEAVDSFFNAMNAIALISKTVGRLRNPDASSSECVDSMHECICSLVDGLGGEEVSFFNLVEASFSADVLLLLNCLYPSCVLVGKLALLNGIARIPPHFQKMLHSRLPIKPPSIEDVGLSECGIDEVRRFWSAFRRTDADKCAWKWAIKPFLVLILGNDGGHNIDIERASEFRGALDTAARASWLVHSPDGASRPPDSCPASGASGPMNISRHHLDPVFVGDEDHDLLQRGCLIGLKPHSYRQVISELLGSHIDGVICNVVINEGGLSLRVSSDPTILDEHGNERTDKSVSPTQCEADFAAYGSRENKLIGARKQKSAWDANARLMAPLFTSLLPPRSAGVRSRGEFGSSSFYRQQEEKFRAEQQPQSEEFAQAALRVKHSSVPDVARRVNAALRDRRLA